MCVFISFFLDLKCLDLLIPVVITGIMVQMKVKGRAHNLVGGNSVRVPSYRICLWPAPSTPPCPSHDFPVKHTILPCFSSNGPPSPCAPVFLPMCRPEQNWRTFKLMVWRVGSDIEKYLLKGCCQGPKALWYMLFAQELLVNFLVVSSQLTNQGILKWKSNVADLHLPPATAGSDNWIQFYPSILNSL